MGSYLHPVCRRGGYLTRRHDFSRYPPPLALCLALFLLKQIELAGKETGIRIPLCLIQPESKGGVALLAENEDN